MAGASREILVRRDEDPLRVEKPHSLGRIGEESRCDGPSGTVHWWHWDVTEHAATRACLLDDDSSLTPEATTEPPIKADDNRPGIAQRSQRLKRAVVSVSLALLAGLARGNEE